jgi:hypothetical protein
LPTLGLTQLLLWLVSWLFWLFWHLLLLLLTCELLSVLLF